VQWWEQRLENSVPREELWQHSYAHLCTDG
jgi:hypothetical protein